MEASSKLRAFSARRFRFWAALFLPLLVLTFGWRVVFPIWQKSRADAFASRAQDAFEEKHLEEAEEFVGKALHLRPNDARYLRLAGRIFATERKADSFAYYKALLRSGQATDRDRFELIELAFVFGKPALAASTLDEVLRREPISARALFYGALLEEKRQNLVKAIARARTSVKMEPDNRDFIQNLARLLYKRGTPESVVEAKKILFDLGNQNGRRLPIIRQLATMDLSKSEAQQLIEWLKSIPLRRLPDLFLGYDLLYRADTNRLDKLADDVIRTLASNNIEEKAELGAWLNRYGLYEKTLRVAKPEADFKDERLASVYLEALLGAGKVNEAMDFAARAEKAGATKFAMNARSRLETNAPATGSLPPQASEAGGDK